MSSRRDRTRSSFGVQSDRSKYFSLHSRARCWSLFGAWGRPVGDIGAVQQTLDNDWQSIFDWKSSWFELPRELAFEIRQGVGCLAQCLFNGQAWPFRRSHQFLNEGLPCHYVLSLHLRIVRMKVIFVFAPAGELPRRGFRGKHLQGQHSKAALDGPRLRLFPACLAIWAAEVWQSETILSLGASNAWESGRRSQLEVLPACRQCY